MLVCLSSWHGGLPRPSRSSFFMWLSNWIFLICLLPLWVFLFFPASHFDVLQGQTSSLVSSLQTVPDVNCQLPSIPSALTFPLTLSIAWLASPLRSKKVTSVLKQNSWCPSQTCPCLRLPHLSIQHYYLSSCLGPILGTLLIFRHTHIQPSSWPSGCCLPNISWI